MPLIIQKNRFLLLAALIALLLAFLHVSALLRGAGESQFFWSAHAEGVSLTTIGRWNNDLVARDGMSGEFHVLYQYLSDWIINRVADLVRRPPFEVQVFYGAFLHGALVLVVYLSVFKFVGSAPVALVSALMVALLSDPILVDPLYLLAGESDALRPKLIFHVPAGAIALGTAQCLGYFLFIPAIITIFISQWRGSYLYAVLAGLLLGLIAQISFLTLIGLASAAGAGLALVAILHHATLEQRGALAAKAVLLVAGSSAVALFANGNFTMVHFVVLWAILFGAGVTSLTGAAVLSVTLLSSLVVASPFFLHLFEFRSAMARLETPVSMPVRLATLFIFFLPAWIALALLCFQKKPREHIYQLTYLIGAVVALLLITKGDLWGFRNHQYRFAILLIFPLSVLFAIAIFTRWRQWGLQVVVALLVMWVSASMLRNLAGISGVDKNIYNALGTFFNLVYYGYADRDVGTYLLTLRTATEEAKQAGSRRILLAPEYSYPKGLTDSALALGVSQLPAFIPDHRYLINTASYADRLRIFCFLFPGYPHFDPHTGLRACTGMDGSLILNEGRPIFSIRDLSLKANILDLLGIVVLADLGSPFREELLKYADAYGMQAIMSSQRALVMRRSARRDRPVIISKSRDAEGINFTVTAPSSSRYVVILAGQDILSRFSEIRFADKREQRWEFRRDVVIGKVVLNPGANDLFLGRCRGIKEIQNPEQTSFYFVAAINEDNFDNLIATDQSLPQLGMNPASAASTCPGLLRKAPK